MFERFTDRSRRAIVLAQDDARTLNHNWIGTEHVLLGLVREGGGVAAQVLEELGFTHEKIRKAVLDEIGQGENAVVGHISYTPRTKRVLELSLREALTLGHNYVGTEHLLLGLVREGNGVGCRILGDLPTVRKAVIVKLSGYEDKDRVSAIERVLTNDRLRGYQDIQLALEESFQAGRDKGAEEILVEISGLANSGGGMWSATLADKNGERPVYLMHGDPNAVAVGRFKASLRKFLGVD